MRKTIYLLIPIILISIILALAYINFDSTDNILEIQVAFPNLSFTRPVDIQDPLDGSNRLFVVEQQD